MKWHSERSGNCCRSRRRRASLIGTRQCGARTMSFERVHLVFPRCRLRPRNSGRHFVSRRLTRRRGTRTRHLVLFLLRRTDRFCHAIQTSFTASCNQPCYTRMQCSSPVRNMPQIISTVKRTLLRVCKRILKERCKQHTIMHTVQWL